MENYINEETVVKDGVYLIFKDDVICPICSNLIINPMMCMRCQNVYCKKCIEAWSKKDNKCPNRCENPDYHKSLEKSNILSKLKFKCEKCGEEILYNNVQKHMNNCESIQTNNGNVKRLKRIKKEEINKIKTNGKMVHINCKKFLYIIYFIINIVITLGMYGVGKTCLIHT